MDNRGKQSPAEKKKKKKPTKYKSNTPKAIHYRYTAFINQYINNGFNATQAYKTVYKAKQSTCEQNGSNLLKNIKVVNLLCAKLAEIGNEINAEWVKHKLLGIIEGSKAKDSEKIKALDLISAIIGAKRPEMQVNQAFFSDVDTRLKDIIAKRLNPTSKNK